MRLTDKVVIGAVLLGLTLVLMARRGNRKVDSYYASLRSDMLRAIDAQNTYFAAHGRYTTVLDSLRDPYNERRHFEPSPGVELAVTRADSAGWELVGRHQLLPTVCTWRDGAPPRPVPDFSGIRRLCTDPP